MVVKINFHVGKNHFFSPVSGANFRAGYACRGNANIWLVGTRGKTCFGGQLENKQARYTRAMFQIQLPTKTSFTANANQYSIQCMRALPVHA